MKVLELIYGSLFFYGLIICRLSKRIFLHLKTDYDDEIQLILGLIIVGFFYYVMAKILVWVCANVFGIVGGL
jgi:hypothetical protein